MCRYAHHIYKAPYACFKCRKMFKQTSTSDIRVKQRDTRSEVKCPQCKQLMKAMGHDFKTPKQNDLKQWKKYCLSMALNLVHAAVVSLVIVQQHCKKLTHF